MQQAWSVGWAVLSRWGGYGAVGRHGHGVGEVKHVLIVYNTVQYGHNLGSLFHTRMYIRRYRVQFKGILGFG